VVCHILWYDVPRMSHSICYMQVVYNVNYGYNGNYKYILYTGGI